MKTNKWLRIALTALLTLIVLGGVAFAGYRVGVTQNPQVVQQWMQWRALRSSRLLPPALPQGNAPAAPQTTDGQQAQPQQQGVAPLPQNPKNWKMNPRAERFDPRDKFNDRFDRRDGFFPFPNLLTLILLAALLWLGYKYAKSSGWKLVRETPQNLPPASAQDGNPGAA